MNISYIIPYRMELNMVFPGKPAHSCGLLRIGDTILLVNDHNLRNCYHRGAVSVFQSVGEEVVMEVVYVADIVSDNSDDEGETQERLSPSVLITAVQPHNDNEHSSSSESEYDSPDSSIEPDHSTNLIFTFIVCKCFV